MFFFRSSPGSGIGSLLFLEASARALSKSSLVAVTGPSPVGPLPVLGGGRRLVAGELEVGWLLALNVGVPVD